MKRVLITGANSFLGNNTKEYLENNGDYKVDIVDMLDGKWRELDFSSYDVVFNVCAIVHRPKEKDAIYYEVNRDLAVEIAKKAKSSGVRQFIQTSTNGVFGIDLGEMSENSPYKPRNAYEKSKYEADCLLGELKSNSFKVCIIRPPLIYGNNCKGNFPTLEKFALKFPFFPSRKNKKDFIYVENLADFIMFVIDNEVDGVCYPRDAKPISVSELIVHIANCHNKKMRLWSFFNPFVALVYRISHKMRLVFGDNYCTIRIAPAVFPIWNPPFDYKTALYKMYKFQSTK